MFSRVFKCIPPQILPRLEESFPAFRSTSSTRTCPPSQSHKKQDPLMFCCPFSGSLPCSRPPSNDHCPRSTAHCIDCPRKTPFFTLPLPISPLPGLQCRQIHIFFQILNKHIRVRQPFTVTGGMPQSFVLHSGCATGNTGPPFWHTFCGSGFWMRYSS